VQAIWHFLAADICKSSVGFLVFGSSLVTWLILKHKRNVKAESRLPPLIPGGYFLLGNIFQVDPKTPHLSLTELSKKHGDIFRLRMLTEDLIFVSGAELIKEVLVTQSRSFAGRPSLFRINYGFHYKSDIIFGTYNSKWSYMKKIVTQGLRKFGSGVQHIDNAVKEEMVALVDGFKDHQGQDFDPRVLLLTSVLNGVSSAIIGCRYHHEDPQMEQYKLTTRLFSESCGVAQGLELDVCPWLRFFPNEAFRKLTESRDMLDKLVDQEIANHKERYIPGDATCILDMLQNIKDDSGSDEDLMALTESDIRTIFIDLLVSGSLTTAITLSTIVALLATNSRLQQQLRNESDRTVGKDRLACSEDRDRMPLLEATILETLRYISHVPLNLPHFTIEDANIGGYQIPKGTQVFTNLWAMHHDPKIWRDPWTFNPRRFLDINGRLLPPTDEKRKYLMPFGAGRRMCMGENIARERIFLFAAALIQKFQFLPPTKGPMPSIDPRNFDLGLILEPKPFCVKPVLRKRLTSQTSEAYDNTEQFDEYC